MLFDEAMPRLALAPMAGVTDRAFRTICRRWGARYTVSEMVSAKAACFGDRKSRALWRPAPGEVPFAVQLFGSESEAMARAAALAWEQTGCQVIDLNMGCPAPKIVANGDGCALMRRPDLAGAIIERVRGAVPVPVTVKFRLGWSGEEINYLELGRVAQQAGAAAVCLHARTRTQMYAGRADWSAIARLKRELRIPVIGNGDVFEPQDAARRAIPGSFPGPRRCWTAKRCPRCRPFPCGWRRCGSRSIWPPRIRGSTSPCWRRGGTCPIISRVCRV